MNGRMRGGRTHQITKDTSLGLVIRLVINPAMRPLSFQGCLRPVEHDGEAVGITLPLDGFTNGGPEPYPSPIWAGEGVNRLSWKVGLHECVEKTTGRFTGA